MRCLVFFVIFRLTTSVQVQQSATIWAKMVNASSRRYRLHSRSHEYGNKMTGCFLKDFYLSSEVHGHETYKFKECGRVSGGYPFEVTWVADIYPSRNSTEKAVIDVRKEGESDITTYSVKHSDEPGECFLLTFIDSGGKEQCELYVWDEPLTIKTEECKTKYSEFCSEKHDVTQCEC